jgi:hypothetical protein
MTLPTCIVAESVNAGKVKAEGGGDVLDTGDWVGAEVLVGRVTEIEGCPLSQAEKIKTRNRMADKFGMNRMGLITFGLMGYKTIAVQFFER